jgi:hypothetical protein
MRGWGLRCFVVLRGGDRQDYRRGEAAGKLGAQAHGTANVRKCLASSGKSEENH